MSGIVVIRRLVEAAGVACIYGGCEQISRKWDDKSTDISHLIEQKKNIAIEGKQLILLLQKNLREEVKFLFNKELSNEDGSATGKTLSQLIQNETGILVPEFVLEDKDAKYSEINDTSLKNICALWRNNKQRDIKSVLKEYSSIEFEILKKYTNKQLEINDTITFYQSFMTSEKRKYQTIITSLFQIVGCTAFVSGLNKIWPISITTSTITDIKNIKGMLSSSKLRFILSFVVSVPFLIYGMDSIQIQPSSDRVIHSSIPSQKGYNPYETTLLPKLPLWKRFPKDIFQEEFIYEYFQYFPTIENGATMHDPINFMSLTQALIVIPFTQAYIFRNILFNSLLKYNSKFVSSYMSAVSLTAAAYALSMKKYEIYNIDSNTIQKDIQFSTNGSVINDRDSMVSSTYTTSEISLKPIVLQTIQSFTNSFPFAVNVDVFYGILKKFYLYDETNVTPILTKEHLNSPIAVSSDIISAILSIFFRGVWSAIDNLSIDEDRQKVLSKFMDECIPSFFDINNISGNKNKSFESLTIEDFIDFFIAAEFAVNNMEVSLSHLRPPTPNTATKSNHSDYVGDSSHYYLFESTLNAHKIELKLQNFGKDKLTKDFMYSYVKYFISECFAEDDDSIEVLTKDLQLFKERLLYWSNPTEEMVLDLIQELNSHQMQKALSIAENYVLNVGSLYMVSMQGKTTIDPSYLDTYYKNLIITLKNELEFEQRYFLASYGLSERRYYDIVEQLVNKNGTEVTTLLDSWNNYFSSKPFRESILKDADPILHYRSQNESEEYRMSNPSVLNSLLESSLSLQTFPRSDAKSK